MNGYIAFYNNKKIEVHANSSYTAQQKAAREFNLKSKHDYKVTVVLVEKSGNQVEHSTSRF
jgi:hypothetical protein